MTSSKSSAGIRRQFPLHTIAAGVFLAGVVSVGCGMRTNMHAYSEDETGGTSVVSTGGKATGGYGAGGGRTGGYPNYGGGLPTGGTRTGGIYPTGGTRTGGLIPTGGTRTGGLIPTGGYYPTGGVRTGGLIPTGGYYPTGGVRTGGYYPTGGALPTGGTPGVSCPNATNTSPCGGDVSGSWTVSSGCLRISGDLDLSPLGLGCKSATVNGALKVSGNLYVDTQGKFKDSTTTTGEESLSLSPKCLEISGTRTSCEGLGMTLQQVYGYSTLRCSEDSKGGCSCSGVINQRGSLGMRSMDPLVSGTMTITKEWIVTGSDPLTVEDIRYAYCSVGNRLSLTPLTTAPTTTGTITFNKDGTTATGGVIGSGGVRTGGIYGTGGTTTGGTTCVRPANDEIVDDFSDGDGFIPMVNGRQGAWRTSIDSSPSAVIYPAPNTLFTPQKSDDVCRAYAAYIKGTGAVLWGSSVSCGLGSPYNASKYSGISFWAKSALGPLDIRVSLPNRDTHPDGGVCQSSATGCYNHFGSYVTLTTEWKRYDLPFQSMRQEPGWGLKEKFDTASVYQVQWALSQGKEYAFWLDDLSLTIGTNLLY